MISVCMATYNGEKFIKEQIDSILSQLNMSDELIISDSGSSDSTIELIKSYQDGRIVFLPFSNIGMTRVEAVASNFQNALLRAKGDYIFLSDQDDVWLPGKVDKCLAYLKKYDMVSHDCIIIDSEGSLLLNSYFEMRNTKSGLLNNLVKFRLLGCCMAFRKNMLSYILPMDLSVPHDQWIYLVSELFGKSICFSDKLIKYRRHGDNISSVLDKSSNSFWEMFLYRVFLIRHLFCRFFLYSLS